jgi:hypothetical protein
LHNKNVAMVSNIVLYFDVKDYAKYIIHRFQS